jgi:hypothetical protein
MVHAKKKYCTLNMGEVAFSPNVNMAKGQCFVWQMIVAKAVSIAGNALNSTVTLWDAKRSFKAVDKECWQLKLRAPMKREEFLQDHSQDEALKLEVQKWAKQALVHE